MPALLTNTLQRWSIEDYVELEGERLFGTAALSPVTGRGLPGARGQVAFPVVRNGDWDILRGRPGNIGDVAHPKSVRRGTLSDI